MAMQMKKKKNRCPREIYFTLSGDLLQFFIFGSPHAGVFLEGLVGIVTLYFNIDNIKKKETLGKISREAIYRVVDESEAKTATFLESNYIRSKLTSIYDILNKKMATVKKLEDAMLDLLEEPEVLELLVKEQMKFKTKSKKIINTPQEYINKQLSSNGDRRNTLTSNNGSNRTR